jgi:hypothetical protein
MTHISDGVNASSNNPYRYYVVYEYPASTRMSFQVAVDSYQRVLLHGTLTFIFGVYDSGALCTRPRASGKPHTTKTYDCFFCR